MTIGQQIRKYRKLKRWSLAELGEKAELAISTLSDAERGETALSVKSLERVAEALGIDIDYLFKKE